MTGKLFTGRILPALGLLIALAGLGVSIYLSMDKSAEPADAGPAAAAALLTAADFPAAGGPEPGHQVGNRIPDFTLELADGRAVAAADLIAAGRPTFLFFWATT